MSVKISLEIGHTASVKLKPQNGFTHDWELYVRSHQDITHYIDKVVFNLHESFAKPKRTLKEPPYVVKESGYAGFEVVIDLYLKNRDEPKKISFHYDLDLQNFGPSICRSQTFTHTFFSPSEEFRRKLLKGGGVSVHNTSMINNFDEKSRDRILPATAATAAGPTVGSNGEGGGGGKSAKGHGKASREPPVNSEFANLFGTPITKTAGSSAASLKVSPDPKAHRKASPNRPGSSASSSSAKGPSAAAASSGGGKGNNSTGGSSSVAPSSKDKPSSSSSSSKYSSGSRHATATGSPHVDRGDKYERREEKGSKRERNRSREREGSGSNNKGEKGSSGSGSNNTKDKSQKRRPSSPAGAGNNIHINSSTNPTASGSSKSRSPTRNSDYQSSAKGNSGGGSAPTTLPTPTATTLAGAKGGGAAAENPPSSSSKKSSKKEKKDRSHDKDRGGAAVASPAQRDQQQQSQTQSSKKDKEGKQQQQQREGSSNAKEANQKYSSGTMAAGAGGGGPAAREDKSSAGKKDEKRVPDREASAPSAALEPPKKHKHKKNKEKNKGKEQEVKVQSPAAAALQSKGPGGTPPANLHQSGSSTGSGGSGAKEKKSREKAKEGAAAAAGSPATGVTKSSISSMENAASSYGVNNKNYSNLSDSEGSEQLAEPLPLQAVDHDHGKASKAALKAEKGEKRKRRIKEGLVDGSPNKMEPPQKLPRKQAPPSAEDGYLSKNGSESSLENLTNNNVNSFSPHLGSMTQDRMMELKELQHKIMTLQDSNDLQQVVEIIAVTGQYEIAQATSTFDFDLCALEKETVQRLQDFFQTRTKRL